MFKVRDLSRICKHFRSSFKLYVSIIITTIIINICFKIILQCFTLRCIGINVLVKKIIIVLVTNDIKINVVV